MTKRPLRHLDAAEGGEERLSIFKDFLEGLDLGDLNNDKSEGEDEN